MEAFGVPNLSNGADEDVTEPGLVAAGVTAGTDPAASGGILSAAAKSRLPGSNHNSATIITHRLRLCKTFLQLSADSFSQKYLIFLRLRPPRWDKSDSEKFTLYLV